MEANHLSYFKVENFKKFDELEINNIGQFNLIVGDNNVGKTSLLEALLVDDKGYIFFESLFYILTTIKKFDKLNSRSANGFIDYYLKNSISKNETQLTFTTKNINNTITNYELRSGNNNFERKWIANDISEHLNLHQYDSNVTSDARCNSLNLKYPFIPFGLNYDHNLTQYFSNYIQLSNSRESNFINSLKIMIPNISGIKVNAGFSTDPVLLVGQNGVDEVFPLATFGDGVLKYFKLLISIVIHSGKRLMIDEVDTGVHYSRMKEFWQTIIQASIDNKVQLFATTHSKECLQYFKEAIAELKQENEARVIRLVEHKDKSIKSYTYNFEQFEQSIDYNEIR